MPQAYQKNLGKLPIHEITPEVVADRLSYRLGRVVGTGRRWSYHEVAKETRIDVRTLKAYVQGTACPNLVKYKRLLAVLGPEIGVDLNAMKGWLPRSDVVPPEALDLDGLRFELRRAIEVLAGLLKIDATALPAPGEAAEGSNAPSLPAGPAEGTDTDPRFRVALRADRIDSEAVSARLGYRLRKMIGDGRRCALATLADATRIDRRTLQTYIDGSACPNLARYLKLGHFLGPEIGVELAYMIGWEPRYQQPLPLMKGKVELLLRSLQAAEAAVSDFRGSACRNPSQLRLIRPDCRIDPADFADVGVVEALRRVRRQPLAAPERT